MTITNEPEKVAVERATAERFLEVYNQQQRMEFRISELADSPDVRCVDARTSDVLNLGICVLEDKPGYARRRGVWLLTLKDESGLSKDDILRIDPELNTASP